MPGFGLAVAFADLTFNFFGHHVNGRIQVFLFIFGEQIRATNPEADGAGKRFGRGASFIMLQNNSRINRPLVHVIQLLDLAHDVFFNRGGERDVVRDDDQFHGKRMRRARRKIQRNKLLAGKKN